MKSVFTVDQIRRAEETLLVRQSHPDEMMIAAASAVADVASAMLERELPVASEDERVLLIVGSGGNGGDALYAGAFLAEEEWRVDALLVGDRVHQAGLEYFTSQGGRVLDSAPSHYNYRLLIDGILGIGGHGGIAVDIARYLENFYSAQIPVLAVDVPSGVDADTGALPEPATVVLDGYEQDAPVARQKIPTHVLADVTVTFGGLRRAHAVNRSGGQGLLVGLHIEAEGGVSLAATLAEIETKDAGPKVYASRAWSEGPALDIEGAQPIGRQFISLDLEPHPDSDKYSGGVVGVLSGSRRYPGAALLSLAGAVRASSSMVRYVGSAPVTQTLPEVVAAPTLPETGRVQAWVFGPGRGTGLRQIDELSALLSAPEPVLIDADGITLLARSARLRSALRARRHATVLTPHAGEFSRLAEQLGEIASPLVDPIGAALAMAAEFNCCVLLKGRTTIVATGDFVFAIDAGHSWSATPGSGDVLAGVIGAHLAHSRAELDRLPEFIPEMELPESAVYSIVAVAVTIHAVAAALSARTEFGPAPTSASRIADAVPAATASVNAGKSVNFQ
ncbi:bifunctional ADP-dependent NAD(P)H-hydrate dehydratase/NAD(P)H-hydrate epimerase [Corynebacterium pacaense]|uniref:bifunctional ADP-dependent NAD(P)H-hydrate dehydratase/NAD(P)H-hydrate epimerase n=1 Tax=Corynebacterium pacaense TaxID=1816684 RepID=UPI0009BB2D0A|nr:bifunctional ADP-dependent NAD(P)H-hydrate dehydratase/NAD(P)H-hydrate epimerase [Corynebacterium pacaense]